MKRMLRAALLVLLSVVGMGKMRAQEFTEGYLNYSVNDDGVSVTVTGHVYNSYYASGTLDIPESVTAFWGTNYTVTAIGDSAFSFIPNLLVTWLFPIL